MQERGKEERRRQYRFPVNCRAYAVDTGFSGLITDASRCGIGVRCIARKGMRPRHGRLDICVDECDFRLTGLPYTVVDERPITGNGLDPDLFLVHLGVHFENLTPNQECLLEYFLRTYGYGSVPSATDLPGAQRTCPHGDM